MTTNLPDKNNDAHARPRVAAQDTWAAFERDGFVGPIRIYEPDEARELLHKIRTDNLDRSLAVFDNDVNYDRHFDIPDLAEHIGNARIIERVREIIGPDFFCWRTEFFPKFPGGSGTEWHQVANYQYATGVPMLHPTRETARPIDVTVWTCFTEATRENGCMKFLPGSHKVLYFDESRAVKTGRAGDYTSVAANTNFFGYDFGEFKVDPDWIPDEREAVAMEMQPGECVIFSARCVHGSFPNTTKRSLRFALTSRYIPTHVRAYPDWTEFHAHGGHFDLDDWGCVLVSGKDDYHHNRVRTTDNHDRPFPYRPL